VSTDDTRLWRNGKHVPDAQWHRDPLGPPFQTNLRWGHRFLQASLVLPLYQQDGESSSRSIPVRFEMAPVVKKPGKRASEEERADYRRLKKEKNLSVQFVALTQELREHLNQTGHSQKLMIQVGDGSFCNRTVFKQDWTAQKVSLVVRCRKDIVLCKRAPGKGPRFYGKTKFWNEHSVRKVPALLVAMYSWLLLAGLHCYGPQRTQDFQPLPKWRRAAKRPSGLDLITLLRKHLVDKPIKFPTAHAHASYRSMVAAAAA
jgi:hypothetical protein